MEKDLSEVYMKSENTSSLLRLVSQAAGEWKPNLKSLLKHIWLYRWVKSQLINFFKNQDCFFYCYGNCTSNWYLSCLNTYKLLFQNMGNVCLGILNGSEVGMEDLNLIGGRNHATLFSSDAHSCLRILSIVLLLSTFLCFIIFAITLDEFMHY
jgi:hypothetical protein